MSLYIFMVILQPEIILKFNRHLCCLIFQAVLRGRVQGQTVRAVGSEVWNNAATDAEKLPSRHSIGE